MQKKEKKNWLSIILAMVLLLCLTAQPVWAAERAEYPIILDNPGWEETLGYGRNVDGSVFVPLRLLFEEMSATVNWQESTRTITINRCDGAVLLMRVGQPGATLTRLGQTEELAMLAPRLIDGVTYIPLRFVAENLLCEVVWDNNDKTVTLRKYFVNGDIDGKSYTLDFATGEVTELAAGGVMCFLGQVPALADAYKAKQGWVYYWYFQHINKLSDGSVVIDISGYPMDPPVSHEIRLLLTDEAQNNRYVWGSGPTGYVILSDYYVDDTDFWWPEGDAVYKLDAGGDVLAEYKYADMLVNAEVSDYPGYSFCFTDGEYMLINCYLIDWGNGRIPLLVNMQTKEAVNLVEKIVPEQYHKGFTYSATDFGSGLWFEKAEDGVLYMTHHYWDGNVQDVLLTYKYK